MGARKEAEELKTPMKKSGTDRRIQYREPVHAGTYADKGDETRKEIWQKAVDLPLESCDRSARRRQRTTESAAPPPKLMSRTRDSRLCIRDGRRAFWMQAS